MSKHVDFRGSFTQCRGGSASSSEHLMKMERLQKQIDTISSMKSKPVAPDNDQPSSSASSYQMDLSHSLFVRPNRPMERGWSSTAVAVGWPWVKVKDQRQTRRGRHQQCSLAVRHVHRDQKIDFPKAHSGFSPKTWKNSKAGLQSGSSVAMKKLIASVIDEILGAGSRQEETQSEAPIAVSDRDQFAGSDSTNDLSPLNLCISDNVVERLEFNPHPPPLEEASNSPCFSMNEYCLKKLKLRQASAK